MKATRKLIPALAMLLVAAVVMSTASFAWFTMSREVTAKGMNVTVTAPNNLLIKGADAGQVFSAEGTSSIGDGTTLGLIKAIKPASSIDGLSFFAIKEGQSVTAADGKRTASTVLEASNTEATTAAEGYYVDFPYTVKTEGETAVDVYVKSFVVTKLAGGSDNGIKAVRAAVLNTDGTALYTGVTNAVLVPAGAANATANKAVASLTTDGDPLGLAVLGDVKAAVIGTAASANKVFTVPARNAAVEGEEELQIVIRVWIEGEDLSCTVVDASELNFNITVVLADAAYTG